MITKLKRFIVWDKRSPAQNIALSFLLMILIGTILLALPISNADGNWLSVIDALFTATSASCVTGLVSVITAEQFSGFGQVVILILIQAGGLGVMTIMAIFILMLKNKFSMNEKIAMKEMLNHEKISNMKSFVLDIVSYTFFFEAIGLILLASQFIPEFGLEGGLWKALFISVSAFCNAGFDNIASLSLIPYQTNIIINFTVMGLIVLGGLGFAVWFDIRDKVKKGLINKKGLKSVARSLSLHSKIVITMTLCLIIVPALIILAIEWSNPLTLGNLNAFEKIMCCLFQSVTLRTAGFASLNYAGLSMATQFLMVIVMFIGGSPGGTAGGIKTTTLAVVLILVHSKFTNKSLPSIFSRGIDKEIIYRACVIITINILALCLGVFALCISENMTFMELLFEAASAMATVGLTLGITPALTAIGKIIIILLMYIGRIGAITFLISMIGKKHQDHVVYPTGNIIVG